MQFQHARPVTLKRADIKTQLQNTVSGRYPLKLVLYDGAKLISSAQIWGRGREREIDRGKSCIKGIYRW